MPHRNIVYKSSQIRDFFKDHRKNWDELYPSEKWVFEKTYTMRGFLGNLLDVGCACGGLGRALDEQSFISSYTGIDINSESIEFASKNIKLTVPLQFVSGDIVTWNTKERYDTVVSLSCADWNIETESIIQSCWERVKDNGYFIISLRLTSGKSINDIERSYQYIDFTGTENKPEIANYVVFSFQDITKILLSLKPLPDLIGAYGYWGKPSHTAVTIYNKIVFAVFYLRKSIKKEENSIQCEFSLPVELFLENSRTIKENH